MNRERVFSEEEVESIHLEGLINDAYGEFVNDALILAKESEAIEERFPELLAEFEAKVERGQQAMLKLVASPLPSEISAEADKRVKAQTAFKSGARAAMGMPDAEVAAAGERLLKLAHDYEAHAKGGKVDVMTNRVSEWLLDMKENYWADVQTTGLEVLYNQLKAVNDRVCEMVLDYVKENSDKVVGVVKEARAECNAAYRNLVKGVNAVVFLEGVGGFADFIKYMNSLIERYKRLYLPGKKPSTPTAGPDEEIDGDEVTGGEEGGEQGSEGTGSGSETEEGEQGSETTEPTFTVTYIKGQYTWMTQQYAPGDRIVPPAEPEAYRWVDVPEFMPDHDITIYAQYVG